MNHNNCSKIEITNSKDKIDDNNHTISGFPKLSGEYNRGYTRAIKDIQEVFAYIQPDLKHHRKNLTGKLSLELLSCCLENREKLREYELKERGFIRYNGQKKGFEWYNSEKE